MNPATFARTVALMLGASALGGHAHTIGADQKAPAAEENPVAATGTLDNAPYRIDIPKNWNHQLVMLLHGYEPKGSPRADTAAQNEATPVFLAHGYAVAQSAFSSQGWAVAEALPENERLRAHFAEKYGKPRRTYAVGFSLGGHVALASLEKYGANYDGALSLCGVNMPAAQAFDEAMLTTLVAFDYFFPGVMGLAKNGLTDAESPAMVDPQGIEAALEK